MLWFVLASKMNLSIYLSRLNGLTFAKPLTTSYEFLFFFVISVFFVNSLKAFKLPFNEYSLNNGLFFFLEYVYLATTLLCFFIFIINSWSNVFILLTLFKSTLKYVLLSSSKIYSIEDIPLTRPRNYIFSGNTSDIDIVIWIRQNVNCLRLSLKGFLSYVSVATLSSIIFSEKVELE